MNEETLKKIISQEKVQEFKSWVSEQTVKSLEKGLYDKVGNTVLHLAASLGLFLLLTINKLKAFFG